MKIISINDLLENIEFGDEDESEEAKAELCRRIAIGNKSLSTLAQIEAAIKKSIDYNDLGIMVTAIMAERG